MKNALKTLSDYLDKFSVLDTIVLLILRLYLAPIFISAGLVKLSTFESTVSWFGNPDWGLGLPFPQLMAFLATSAEIVGGLALLFGIGARIMSLPLMVTMLVAAITAHWHNGWFAIAPSNPDTSMAQIFDKLGFQSASQSLQNSSAVSDKLAMANQILQEHGNYDWLTEAGSFVVLNNGIEFAATYFVMLGVILAYGSGKLSIDHLIKRKLHH